MQEKVAIVTGAAMGIGRAVALAFSKQGAKVVIADIAVSEGKAVADEIKHAGGKALFVETDVADAAAVANMVDTTLNAFGRLDYACNNAGIGGSMQPLADYTEQDWNRVLAVNLTGVWHCMKYETAAMAKQGSGAIVNIGSTFSVQAAPEHYAYVASKHGVIGISKCAALEFAKQGIRVNVICPGGTETAQIEECRRLNPQMIGPILAKHPIGRLAQPEEIAAHVIWLCSDSASFVIGSVFNVDGGLLAQG